MRKVFNQAYRFGIGEILVIFVYILLINNYWKTPDQRIKADGMGYYDYLLSTFVFDDLDRKELAKDDPVYNRISQHGFYVDYKEDKKVNKYTCGVAVLQMPFFLFARSQVEEESITGYEKEFSKWAFHGVIFYVFFGLILFRLAFQQFGVDRFSIFICQALVVLATGLTNEINFGSFYSHAFSFFAISGFLYFTRRYFLESAIWLFYIACIFLGFIFIIRQINIIVLLFLPFIAGDWQTLKSGMIGLFKPFYRFFIGVFIIFLIGLIQVYFWYQQTGDFLVYSYGSEVFFFQYPHIFEVLFSYRRSLFVYAPITIVVFLGAVHLLIKKEYYMLITWFSAFYIFVYIISSWWDWTYGASYGQRVFIDYYPFIFLMMAFFLMQLRLWAKFLFLGLGVFVIYVNVIQVYQWNNYILDWNYMTKEKYWRIFLKTDDKYKGILMQLPDDPDQLYTVTEFEIPEKELVAGQEILVGEFTDSITKDRIQYICLEFESDFDERTDAKVVVIVDDEVEKKNLFWAHRHIVHFAKWDFNTRHKGYFLFGLDLPETESPKTYKVLIKSDEYFNSYAKMKLRALRKY